MGKRPFQRAVCVDTTGYGGRGQTPEPSLERTFEQLIQFSRKAAQAALVVSTCGNASLRAGREDRMVITGTGTELEHMTRAGLSLLDLGQGHRLAGAIPSSELEVHRQAYLARPEVNAVLHCQSPSATLLACCGPEAVDLNLIPEYPAYVRRHAWVPYIRPGTRELGEAVGAALRDPEVRVVQLGNHGQLVVGRDVKNVLRSAIFFERACWLATQGRALAVIPEHERSHMRAYGDK